MTAHPETPRLGYIGLGNQGAPMAKRLLDWPGGLTVFDVRVEAMAPFVEGGATAAASVSDVAEADIISITVFDDAQVSSVITADNGLATHAKPGTIVAIHSTIADTTAVDLAEKLKPQGIHIVDAPLLEHTRGLGEKDLSLALALGEVVSVDLPLAQLALQRLAAGLGVPHPDTEPAKET